VSVKDRCGYPKRKWLLLRDVHSMAPVTWCHPSSHVLPMNRTVALTQTARLSRDSIVFISCSCRYSPLPDTQGLRLGLRVTVALKDAHAHIDGWPSPRYLTSPELGSFSALVCNTWPPHAAASSVNARGSCRTCYCMSACIEARLLDQICQGV
jgi:hypothetical protein